MRGSVPGLASPAPIVEMLPAIYQEDGFTQQFTAGFDDVLAPVFNVLDCLDAYLDPLLTPGDFLPWLASWVGVALEEDWPIERQRALVRSAVHIFRYRGTVAGLKAELEIYTGGSVEINETGAVSWSLTPNSPLPGESVPRLAVRVTVDDPATVNQTGLDAIVAAAKPAHVVHKVEVVARRAPGEQG